MFTKEDKEMSVQALNCPNCGSNDVIIDSEKTAFCKNCKSLFTWGEDNSQKNIYVSNTINIEKSEQNKPSLLYVKAKDKVDSFEFTRNALIDLAKNGCTPADIFESDFDNVKTETDSFLVISGNVNVSYSASIGYDKQIRETVYDKTTGKYEEKKRTVTDWQPLSGNKTIYKTGVATLSSSADKIIQAERFLSGYFDNIRFEPYENDDNIQPPVKPTGGDFASAEQMACEDAEYDCEMSLPGDRYSNYNATSVCDTDHAFVASASDHILKFRHHNQEQEIRGFSFTSETTPVKITSDNYNISEEVQQKIISLYAFAILFCVTQTIFNLASFFMKSSNFIIFLTISFVFSVVFGICYLIKRKNIIEKYSHTTQTKKICDLENLLSAKKLKPLSEKEKQELSDISSTKVTIAWKTGKTVAVKILLIFNSVLMLLSLITL